MGVSFTPKYFYPREDPKSSFHFPCTVSVINNKECLDDAGYILKLHQPPALLPVSSDGKWYYQGVSVYGFGKVVSRQRL